MSSTPKKKENLENAETVDSKFKTIIANDVRLLSSASPIKSINYEMIKGGEAKNEDSSEVCPKKVDLKNTAIGDSKFKQIGPSAASSSGKQASHKKSINDEKTKDAEAQNEDTRKVYPSQASLRVPIGLAHIISTTNRNGMMYFGIKWHSTISGVERFAILPEEEIKTYYPQVLIKYYESKSEFITVDDLSKYLSDTNDKCT